MYKLLHIVGTRPQIIKSAALSNTIKARFSSEIQDIKLDTGQHYDANLSHVFYKEMGMDTPAKQVGVQPVAPPLQLTEMIQGITEAVHHFKPNGILVYGDTLSTVAGALVAHTIKLPLFHVEAGLRSHNFTMPEELNRIFADRASTLLFVPTKKAIQNLVKENYRFPGDTPYSINQPGIIFCGDIMFDNYLHYQSRSQQPAGIDLDGKQEFVFMTMHRNYNADKPEIAEEILLAVNDAAAAKKAKVIFPIHPRTKNQLQENNPALWKKISSGSSFIITDPLSYLETIWALKNSSLVLTDSGGLQKESYFSGKHCIILRPETEWVELVEAGKAITVWHKRSLITDAFNEFFGKNYQPGEMYGDGKSAEVICQSILDFHKAGA